MYLKILMLVVIALNTIWKFCWATVSSSIGWVYDSSLWWDCLTLQTLPVKFCTLLAFIRRQIVNILQEVASDAKRTAHKYKLDLFETSMKRIYRQRHENTLNRESGTIIPAKSGGRPAKLSPSKCAPSEMPTGVVEPADLRLDMIAYSYHLLEQKVYYSYNEGYSFIQLSIILFTWFLCFPDKSETWNFNRNPVVLLFSYIYVCIILSLCLFLLWAFLKPLVFTV